MQTYTRSPYAHRSLFDLPRNFLFQKATLKAQTFVSDFSQVWFSQQRVSHVRRRLVVNDFGKKATKSTE